MIKIITVTMSLNIKKIISNSFYRMFDSKTNKILNNKKKDKKSLDKKKQIIINVFWINNYVIKIYQPLDFPKNY